jgi:sugar lactone lactonase YvrE
MTVNVIDNRLLDLVDVDVSVEKIATGYTFTEGPVWHPREKHLTFSDIFGNTQHRWDATRGARVYRQGSDESNGNTYDLEGALVTCEHKARRLSITRPGEQPRTLVDEWEGKRLHSPNDVIVGPHGDVLFTDPTFGLRQPDGTFLDQQYPHPGVFRFSPTSRQMTLLADDFAAPNGIVITDDGDKLYVADSRHGHVRVFDVADDGSLRNGRVFCELDGGGERVIPDGMKIDSLGNLYVTANHALGVFVYAPDGTLLGHIGVGENPANLAWGDDDAQTMFVTAQTSVYRLRMKVPGQAIRLR